MQTRLDTIPLRFASVVERDGKAIICVSSVQTARVYCTLEQWETYSQALCDAQIALLEARLKAEQVFYPMPDDEQNATRRAVSAESLRIQAEHTADTLRIKHQLIELQARIDMQEAINKAATE